MIKLHESNPAFKIYTTTRVLTLLILKALYINFIWNLNGIITESRKESRYVFQWLNTVVTINW